MMIIIKQKRQKICNIFNNNKTRDIKYNVLVCKSCHMMIIQQAKVLGLVHILKHFTLKSELRTLVPCQTGEKAKHAINHVTMVPWYQNVSHAN